MKSRTFNKSFKKVLCWIMMTGIIFFTSNVRIGEAKNKKQNINKATIKNPIVLISQAVKKGILDEETALVYKHYALFRPQFLPHEFVVEYPVLIKSGTPLLDETYERWEGLSPSAKKKINSIYQNNERGISQKPPLLLTNASEKPASAISMSSSMTNPGSGSSKISAREE